MSVERERFCSGLKIYDPADKSNFVKLKVVDEISFIDDTEQSQEYRFKFNNDRSAKRKYEVVSAGDPPIKTERITALTLKVREEDEQEYLYTLLSDPKHHKRTHKTKIYRRDENGKNDESVWIEMTRVDEISFVDPVDGHQERIFTLKWPELDDKEWDYSGFTDVKDTGEPYRLDPFQTITDASFGALRMIIILIGDIGGWNPKPSNFIATINKKTSITFSSLPTERTFESAAVEPWWATAEYYQFLYVNCESLIGRETDILNYFYYYTGDESPAKSPIIIGSDKLSSVADMGISDGSPVSFEISLSKFGGMYEYVDRNTGIVSEISGGYTGNLSIILFRDIKDLKRNWDTDRVRLIETVVGRGFSQRWTWTADGSPWPYDFYHPDTGESASKTEILTWPKGKP